MSNVSAFMEYSLFAHFLLQQIHNDLWLEELPKRAFVACGHEPERLAAFMHVSGQAAKLQQHCVDALARIAPMRGSMIAIHSSRPQDKQRHEMP